MLNGWLTLQSVVKIKDLGLLFDRFWSDCILLAKGQHEFTVKISEVLYVRNIKLDL